jgi:O-antigen/teichoic acid export membrane protein
MASATEDRLVTAIGASEGAGSGRRVLFGAISILFLLASTAVRLLAGFVLLKYLAFRFGPGTFGVLTQVMGVTALFYMFAGGGISNGLIHKISAAPSDAQQRRWMSAGATVNALASVMLAVVAGALAWFGAERIFGDAGYRWVFIVIVGGQFVMGFGALVLAYFSGIGDNRAFAIAQIAGNLLSLLLLVVLAEGFGLRGAMFGLVLGPACVGIVALWQFSLRGGSSEMFRLTSDRSLLANLMSYATLTACALTAIPFAQLLIRVDMSERLTWTDVGYWQAVAKLSEGYMLFVGVVLINYLLPQLSRLEPPQARRALLRFGAALLAIFALAGVVIYLARDSIIVIVYSRQFLPASDLVAPQLLGDAFKIAAFLPYYYLLSRGHVLIIAVAELLQGIGLYGLYYAFVPSGTGAAPVYSHAVTSALLLGLMLALSLITQRQRD